MGRCKITKTIQFEIERARDTGALASCVVFLVFQTLAGIGLLAISVWLYVDTASYLAGSYNDKFFVSIYILMAAGSLMTLIGFLGCCGAMQESSCMLGTVFLLNAKVNLFIGFSTVGKKPELFSKYGPEKKIAKMGIIFLFQFSTFVLLIFAAEIAGAVYAWAHQEEVKTAIADRVRNMIKHEYKVQDAVTIAVDTMQKQLECCGATKMSDWSESAFNKNLGDKSLLEKFVDRAIYTVPRSCCKVDNDEVCNNAISVPLANPLTGALYSEGCITQLEKKIESHILTIVAVGIGIAIIQILGFIFSLVLCCAVSGSSNSFKA